MFKNLGYKARRSNIYLTRISEKDKVREGMLKEMMAEIFPQLKDYLADSRNPMNIKQDKEK